LAARDFYVVRFACAGKLALAVLSYRVDNPNGHFSEALFRDDGGHWTQLARSGPELLPADLAGTDVSADALAGLRRGLQDANTPSSTQASGGVQVLVIPAEDRAALRTTHLALSQNQRYSADQIEGPLPNSVYYALDNSTGTYWALATFSTAGFGTQDQPEVFSKKIGQSWVDLGDTGGNPCKVPAPVLAAWNYRSTSC